MYHLSHSRAYTLFTQVKFCDSQAIDNPVVLFHRPLEDAISLAIFTSADTPSLSILQRHGSQKLPILPKFQEPIANLSTSGHFLSPQSSMIFVPFSPFLLLPTKPKAYDDCAKLSNECSTNPRDSFSLGQHVHLIIVLTRLRQIPTSRLTQDHSSQRSLALETSLRHSQLRRSQFGLTFRCISAPSRGGAGKRQL
ncbi:hypothetical protein CPB83DRAFT_354921 [Crepidotus variabilis]|uniref:Uncharacterized protein n=1 Tax=Crepidotus variabilis TaxID=179855 RepID=A0A9P6EFU9_9AGAR|nr:hypothetical protein CPB83DRAFT_354921 [Crepidotus variabilis]